MQRCAGSITSGSLLGRLVALAGLTLALWAPAAFAQRPLGIDVSYWQGNLTQANWNSIHNAGKAFAIVRATHYTSSGETYAHGDPDPYFASNMVYAHNAGMLAGAYNFARPSLWSPTTDANYFLSYASPYITSGYLRPVLDLEEAGGTTPVGATNLSAWANAWIDYVQQQTGVEAMVYCNSNYARNYLNSTLASRTLWIANYACSTNPQTGSPPNGTGIWSTWKFWQYCSTGSVSGISGNVDLDVFNGTSAQLQGYVIGAAPTISNVQVSGVTSSSATITWTTNAGATSQVKYGLTSSYGSQTALDSTLVTSHSVNVTGLQASTTYHFQALSTNGSGSAQSTDGTFTTSSSGGTDVVVDNTDTACTITGSWTAASTSVHVGTNYLWTSGVTGTTEASATRKIRWTPYLGTSAYYDVYAFYAAGPNRSTNTYWKITNAGTVVTVRLNEQINGNGYTLVASNVPFNAGSAGYVELMNNTGDTAVVQGDAVKFVFKSAR
jgi:GH25 family lysozyme M1 (1,4-beta-N-acetylmuramidase)